MLRFSEWLPNPVGKDSEEWIEIFNDGTAAVNLGDWKITNSAGKAAFLSGEIKPGEYTLVNPGFSLKNSGEKLTLYAPGGEFADESAYMGTAREGQSVNQHGEVSYFGAPTPGAANTVFKAEISSSPFVYGEPLTHSSRTAPFLGMMTGTALTLAITAVLILKYNATANELFFGRN